MNTTAKTFNEHRDRAIEKVPFGWACYDVVVSSEALTLTHRGIVGTMEDAERWLKYQPPEKLTVVYPA